VLNILYLFAYIYQYYLSSLGIVSVKCIRINIDAGGIPRIFYKYDSTKSGWYPKPIEIASELDMQRLFKHDDPTFGEVLRYKEYPGEAMGTRQTWFYDVSYANGEVLTFPVKCISLPIKFSDILIDLNDLSHQVFRGKLIDDRTRETVLNNIIKLLGNRHLNSDIPSWRDFFSKLPVNEGYVFDNTISNFVNNHKRAMQVGQYFF